MPRVKRRESGTGVYHVVARGNNKEKIFGNESDKREFLRILKKETDRLKVEIYAYCVMSNHVHLMLKAELEVLSKLMAKVGSIYAEFYNRKYDRVGHVFQGRFYSDCIESEEYYWCCLRYIHNNPVKILQVKEPFEYKYSSAKEYQGGVVKVISEKSFRMLKSRFCDLTQFWEFHRLYEQKSFRDTAEDELIHNYERVKIAAQKFLRENQITDISSVLSVGKIKKEFLSKSKEELGLSERKIENILRMVSKGDSPQ